MTTDLKCNVKLFADDTSIFSVAQDRNESAADLNHELDLIKHWAHDWRMSFNPQPANQAVEVIFSNKNFPVDHPSIFFNDIAVMKVDEYKHLGVVLNSRLTFSNHIQSAIDTSRRGIGMLIFLSSYLPRHTLDQLYKFYVRPHLDYGDVIYHLPQKLNDFRHEITLNRQMKRLESVQYSSGLAITGAWNGTSRNRLYEELGWESLSDRRWSRRLVLFFKFLNKLTPEYTRHQIPLNVLFIHLEIRLSSGE